MNDLVGETKFNNSETLTPLPQERKTDIFMKNKAFD